MYRSLDPIYIESDIFLAIISISIYIAGSPAASQSNPFRRHGPIYTYICIYKEIKIYISLNLIHSKSDVSISYFRCDLRVIYKYIGYWVRQPLRNLILSDDTAVVTPDWQYEFLIYSPYIDVCNAIYLYIQLNLVHIRNLDLYVSDNRVNPRAASDFNPFRRHGPIYTYLYMYKEINIYIYVNS